jgi:hypothetical protein
MKSERGMEVLLLLVLLAAGVGLGGEAPRTGTGMDIHVVLGGELLFSVLQMAEWLRVHAPGNEVDFFGKDEPHLTLYLTQFESEAVEDVVAAVRAALVELPCACQAYTGGFSASAVGFGLWNMQVSQCLQRLSDLVVRATYRYMVPDQPIPAWVESLPEPARSAKIQMIRLYGSPNVFSQFNPHVTLAFDVADNLTEIFHQMPIPASFPFTVLEIGIGAVGPNGTVLRVGGWGNYRIPCQDKM